MKFKMIASDLDGTLLAPPKPRESPMTPFDFGAVTARSRAAIDRFRSKGGYFAAVTGRPIRWVTDLDLGAGFAICSNGALVIDLLTNEVTREITMPLDAAREAVARLRELHPEGVLAVEFADGVAMEPAWAERLPENLRGEQIGTAEDLLVREPAKVLMRVPGLAGDDHIDAAGTELSDIVEVTASGGLQLIEISALGVNKASTLALECFDRGLTADDVVAFGDARNDLTMFEWAGHSVAMANAHPKLIDIADEVTLSNLDDGVAEWLENHMD